MITDSICPPKCEDSQCLAVPLLHALLDEMKAMHQTLKDNRTEAKKPSKATATKRILVNELIVALQLRNPEKEWTSDSFAKEIGCTGAAVRATEAWKLYQKRQAKEKRERRQKGGYKGRNGKIEAFVPDKKNDN